MVGYGHAGMYFYCDYLRNGLLLGYGGKYVQAEQWDFNFLSFRPMVGYGNKYVYFDCLLWIRILLGFGG